VTNAEVQLLDGWIRSHTTSRFGPVREVEPSLVLEIAFDAVQRSTRHKAGLAMRLPRIQRIRWDKPAGEADKIEVLAALMVG
jgi:DNA ligase 1